jgi:hypothetical protein
MQQETIQQEAGRLTQCYLGMLIAYRTGSGEGEAYGRIRSKFWVQDGCILVRIEGEPEPVPVSRICFPVHQPGVFPHG